MAVRKGKTTGGFEAPNERAIWRGSISFGLVQIPVGLYRADAEHDLHFTMLDKKDHAKVRFERKNSVTGKALGWGDIVKGFEVERGAYVVVTDKDFAAANVQATGNIDIVDFVAEAEVDPAYFVKPYFLLPQGRDAKTYVLLREVLRQTKRVGVAKIVLRTRQHLALVRIYGAGLMLSLLRFPQELRPADSLKFPRCGKKDAGVSARELKMANALVESMTTKFRPENYRDDYHDDLLALIARKRRAGSKGLPAAPRRARAPAHNVVDIVALLQQSVSAKKTGRTKRKAQPTEETAAPRVDRASKTRKGGQAAKPARGGRSVAKRASKRARARPSPHRRASRSGAR